jgi:hypothetical protein
MGAIGAIAPLLALAALGLLPGPGEAAPERSRETDRSDAGQRRSAMEVDPQVLARVLADDIATLEAGGHARDVDLLVSDAETLHRCDVRLFEAALPDEPDTALEDHQRQVLLQQLEESTFGVDAMEHAVADVSGLDLVADLPDGGQVQVNRLGIVVAVACP